MAEGENGSDEQPRWGSAGIGQGSGRQEWSGIACKEDLGE